MAEAQEKVSRKASKDWVSRSDNFILLYETSYYSLSLFAS